MFADITGYNISLWLHISAAVVGLGATFAEALLFQVALKMDPRNMPFVHRAQRAINQRLANPALLIILITGIYQVADGNWSMGDAWISATFAIVIVLGGLLGAYFIPTDKRLEVQAAERSPPPPTAPSASRRATWTSSSRRAWSARSAGC